jgi:hypothetical protein
LRGESENLEIANLVTGLGSKRIVAVGIAASVGVAFLALHGMQIGPVFDPIEGLSAPI